MEVDAFRRHGHALVDWMADYLASLPDRPVVPQVTPGSIRRQLPLAAPERGESFETIWSDFESIVLPGMSHWQHPGWFAYFPGNSSPPSVLAEMATATIAAQCMSWQTSPAATELEQVVLEWLRTLLGFPDGWTGVIQDTASTATFCAMLVARDAAWRRHGREAPLTLYASEEAHSSVWKGARLAGFPEERIRSIGTDGAFAMRPSLLGDAMAADRRAGLVPACLIGTVGTTSSSALDPLRPLGELAREYGAYFHVDAAYAGSAAIAPEHRAMLGGLDLADSVVTNPHKWLLTNFDLTAHYVRDVKALLATFATTPEYLRTAADPEVVNYRDWGIQLGRRFRALKLWFVLRSYGAMGLRAMIREHVRLARLFADWVAGDPFFELMAPVPLGLVCFRHRPPGMGDGPALDAHNARLLAAVNSTGRLFLTHTTLRGHYAIRLVVGQRTTDEAKVREAWGIVRAAAERGDTE